jgi:hypothetical protein
VRDSAIDRFRGLLDVAAAVRTGGELRSVLEAVAGAIAPADLIRSGADVSPVTTALSQLDDPEDLRIRTPVQIQQGTADQTVFQTFTDQTVDAYKQRGNPVTYKTYQGVDHGGAVKDAHSAADATKYVRARFR